MSRGPERCEPENQGVDGVSPRRDPDVMHFFIFLFLISWFTHTININSTVRVSIYCHYLYR